ncbi:hypothetical protein glysoja_017431 [Glycine soja]|nr:hypothetical protein glysoja_017431 [Glycine soja]
MSRKENLIYELHPRKGTWKIAVRITDMWDVKKHNGRQAIDMVLIDQTGAKIGATLWQELFPEFQSKLALGCSYLIQNIKEVERPEIPANVHVITEIADIIYGIAPRHTLVDVVGVVAEVIERKIVNPTYRVTVKLRDNSDAEILMTLWEDYALQLDDAIEKTHFVREPLVLMLTLAKIKDAKGGDEIKVFPECVDDLVGKTLALRFKYRVNMRQSFVMDVSQEEHHIHTLTLKIGLQVIINLS